MLGSENVFYKYLSPASSILVLENRTLKWSNARLFNDPFDMPIDTSFAFDGRSLATALIDELTILSFGDEEPKGDASNQCFASCLITRRAREHGATEDELRNALTGCVDKISESFPNLLQRYEAHLKDMRDSFALLCVSKTNENLLMWSHYAKDHTGCVLGLRCRPDLDRPLCAVKPVEYLREFPLRATLPEYVKHLTGQVELDEEKVFQRFAFAKGADWQYEQEWRGMSELHDRVNGYDFDPLIADELDTVYFGAKIDQGNREQLLALLKREYPNTKIVQARLSRQRYALEFENVG